MTNKLPQTFDLKSERVPVAGIFMPVGDLSRSDREQVLCELMDMMERLEILTHGATQTFADWQHSRVLDSTPVEEAPLRQVPPSLPPTVDAKGRKSYMPVRYAGPGWQWALNGKVIKLEDLSEDDVGQAICVTTKALEVVKQKTQAMQVLMVSHASGFYTPIE